MNTCCNQNNCPPTDDVRCEIDAIKTNISSLYQRTEDLLNLQLDIIFPLTLIGGPVGEVVAENGYPIAVLPRNFIASAIGVAIGVTYPFGGPTGLEIRFRQQGNDIVVFDWPFTGSDGAFYQEKALVDFEALFSSGEIQGQVFMDLVLNPIVGNPVAWGNPVVYLIGKWKTI